MAEFSEVTFTRRYPSFSYFLLHTGQEVKVLEYEDHLEVSATDRRGRWRPRRKMPTELAKYWPTLRKYDLTLEPRESSEVSIGYSLPSGFLPGPATTREPNPTVSIRTEDDRVIWFDGFGHCGDPDCFCSVIPYDKSLRRGR